MNERRQGEIALLLVKHRIIKKGLPGDGFQRDLGNVAKDMGIDVEELRQFYESLLPEMLSHLLGRKSVTLETSN